MSYLDFQRVALCEQAGGSPAASNFSLLRQRKVTKRKATLLSATLRCATGTLRCSVQPGSRSNSPAAQTIAIPDPSGPALLGADRRGWGNKYQQPNSAERALRVLLPDPDFFSPNPSWLGRAAQMEAGSGPQLFERSEFCGPPPESSTASCPERSAGTQTAGRLFFAYFLLAKQKKVSSRRATPGLYPQKNSP